MDLHNYDNGGSLYMPKVGILKGTKQLKMLKNLGIVQTPYICNCFTKVNFFK